MCRGVECVSTLERHFLLYAIFAAVPSPRSHHSSHVTTINDIFVTKISPSQYRFETYWRYAKKDKKRQYRKHRVLTPWTRKIINDRPQWPKHRSNQHHRQSDSKWICPHLAKRRLIWDFSRTGSFPGSTMGSFPRRTCSEIIIRHEATK